MAHLHPRRSCPALGRLRIHVGGRPRPAHPRQHAAAEAGSPVAKADREGVRRADGIGALGGHHAHAGHGISRRPAGSVPAADQGEL